MGQQIDNPAADRSRELAKTGQFASMLELLRQLRREGVPLTALRSTKLRIELVAIIDQRKKATAINRKPDLPAQVEGKPGIKRRVPLSDHIGPGH